MNEKSSIQKLICLHNISTNRVTCLHNRDTKRVTCTHNINTKRVTCMHNINTKRVTCTHNINTKRVTCLHKKYTKIDSPTHIRIYYTHHCNNKILVETQLRVIQLLFTSDVTRCRINWKGIIIKFSWLNKIILHIYY